jgi:prepilin-type N-terminal cleavage/methylation domain-containing protein
MNIQRFPAKGTSGYSLVELIVVIAIITTLLGISTIAFHDWIMKARVEAQVREMVADISNLRVRAMTTKQRHSIEISAGKYAFRSYSSEAELIDNGRLISGGRDVSFRLKKGPSTLFVGERYEFDHRGMLDTGASDVISIFLEHAGDASLDCLNLQAIRVNAGKINTAGDTCNDK